ncbi:MAG: glutamate transporter permease [Desulfacinum sp.]|nr:glutamate transporter permease [Desulfacinum sp.]
MGVLGYDFDWGVLWRAPYGHLLMKGVWTTLHLSLGAWILAVLVGLTVGVLRVLPGRGWRLLGAAYVEVFRNTPLLVHLFFWYFAAPLLLGPAQVRLYDYVEDYGYFAGILGLGTYTASRVAEQFRAAFLSIPPDQYHAAYATGLRTAQVYRYVIVPYAFRLILPAFTTEFLTCFKNSALTMTIGVMETTHAAYYIDSFTWHGLETTTAASLVYLTISGAVIGSMGLFEKRLRIHGMIARSGA